MLNAEGEQRGGYDADIGGPTPWARPKTDIYLLGQLRRTSHAVTDSASSATSMNSGIKTYNAAINIDSEGNQSEPISHQLQRQGYGIGVITSVPISHATPAAAYANNVTRNDYQDLSRDLVGLPSVAHRQQCAGCRRLVGMRLGRAERRRRQTRTELRLGQQVPARIRDRIDRLSPWWPIRRRSTHARPVGTRRIVECRASSLPGRSSIVRFLWRRRGHLPYQTADGGYNPYGEKYSEADVAENPTLADMTRAALGVLAKNPTGFWLMIESGDVDWANHSNNLDNAIGAVLSGDEAFQVLVSWVEKRSNWEETAVIVTADHGHYFVLDDPQGMLQESTDLATAK